METPIVDFMNPQPPIQGEVVRKTKKEQLLDTVSKLLKQRKGKGKTQKPKKGKQTTKAPKDDKNVTAVLGQLQQLELIRILRNLRRPTGETTSGGTVVRSGSRRSRTTFAQPLRGPTGFKGATENLLEQEERRRLEDQKRKELEEAKQQQQRAELVAKQKGEEAKRAEEKKQKAQQLYIEAITEDVETQPSKVGGVRRKRIPLVERNEDGDLVVVKKKGKKQYVFIGSRDVPYNQDERYKLYQEYITKQEQQKLATEQHFREYLEDEAQQNISSSLDTRASLVPSTSNFVFSASSSSAPTFQPSMEEFQRTIVPIENTETDIDNQSRVVQQLDLRRKIEPLPYWEEMREKVRAKKNKRIQEETTIEPFRPEIQRILDGIEERKRQREQQMTL